MSEISKERLVAFTDAVLAIIMTILVLELERSSELTWSALWELKTNFFSYAISFFWLGKMWVNMHRAWDNVEKVNNRLVWISMLLLFFSSFFPYTTSLVANDFNSSVAQIIYGGIVMLVSFTNVWMYSELTNVATTNEAEAATRSHNNWMRWDIAIKVIGMLLSMTVFPQVMMWAVLFTAVVIVVPRSI
ncbi:TMEM175 family protein [Streptococcus macedonicus]|uniref:TMEM175 family protein n=1 Tax=Streptococcus macedonicus TaxID=59310 RepID=UPI0022431E26|nr:TMEM175 family protein [Streptococcus macedonicus]MCW8518267.1 TMEM175 family protein [Streptococcus macedonicus]MCW8520136.1 TMEM175 family protein [Streptococcus macedonicus]